VRCGMCNARYPSTLLFTDLPQRSSPWSRSHCWFVTDNTRFSAGALLVQIDERDFQTALDGAIADLHGAEAASLNARRLSDEQQDLINAVRAAVGGDRAALTFAEQQLARGAFSSKPTFLSPELLKSSKLPAYRRDHYSFGGRAHGPSA
jgi:hypothetical protein